MRALAAGHDERIHGIDPPERTGAQLETGAAGDGSGLRRYGAQRVRGLPEARGDFKRGHRAGGIEDLEARKNQQGDSVGHGRKRGQNVIYALTLRPQASRCQFVQLGVSCA